MSVMQFTKDPQANLDYKWDWSQWLAVGDTINAHTITVTSGDVVLGTHSNDTTSVTAWFSGGTVDTESVVTARVTTTGGRIDDRSILLRIRQR